MTHNMATDLTGKTVEHYRLEALIGRGGMGSVYRAIDLNLARPVAVKVMDEEFSSQQDFQDRFQHEAQTAARLDHPSIVHIYHFGRDQEALFIVMELVPGLSLGTFIKQLSAKNQVIRLDETLLLTAQVAKALGYAHRRGIIHRDIKPDNILVKETDPEERPDEPPLRAVVTDFGLAKLQDSDLSTLSGEMMGTLDYMSPEQLQEEPLDGRSDIYSLGVVLFQLATGQLPFLIKTPSDAVNKHVHESPPVAHEVYPGLPVSLSQVISKAMAKQPENRYQTGEEMAQALQRVAAELALEESDAAYIPDLSSTASMVITLDENPNLADTSRWLGDERVHAPRYDVLRVDRNGEEPESYDLHRRIVTIGRSEGNDVILVGSNVSRWHTRLEYLGEGWSIFDCSSTNGTFLDNTRLAPEKAYPWRAGQVVHIGPFTLHLQLAAEAADDFRPEVKIADDDIVDAGNELPQPIAPVAPPRELIVADVRPRELKQMGIARVLLINKGYRRTPVTVTAGDPNGMLQVDVPSKQVIVAPGEKGIVDFYLEGHRPFLGRRQAYPFTMLISTSERDWDLLEGVLKANPVISIWLILILLLLILLLAAATYGFINGLLPWTPQSLLDLLISYLQGF